MSHSDTTRVMGAGGTTLMGEAGGNDRTLVLGAGAPQRMPTGGDALRTQMGGTTTCQVCKSTTSLLEPYCGDCGFLLTSTPADDTEIPVQEAPPAELVALTDGQRHALREGVNTVGRQGTDILLMDGTVSRNHANITLANGGILVEDLGSSNGTKVGETRIGPNQPTAATPGMILKFGSIQLRLESRGDTAAGSAEQTIVLPADRTIIGTGTPSAEAEGTSLQSSAASTGSQSAAIAVAILRRLDGPGTDILVTQGTLSMGRKPGNTLVLSGDSYVSSRHAELTTDNTGTYLIDMGSTNGTLLNGSKLTANEKQMLIEGDEVQVGQTKYRFELMELFDEEETVAEKDEPAPGNAADVYAQGAETEPLPGEAAPTQKEMTPQHRADTGTIG